VEHLLEFARGPLFRFSFAVMVLGLLRVIVIDIAAAVSAFYRAGDKTLPWGLIIRRTVRWFFPVNRVFMARPWYSVMSILFHVGLLVTPLFLYAHVELWRSAVGFGWATLPKVWADSLTLLAIATALGLIIGRLSSSASRFISRKQDFLWPVTLLVPFATGYVCATMSVSATAYQVLMLVHIISGNIILILLPFTKIAHCVLMPFSQLVSNLAWKFPAETDDAVCTTLDKKGAPV
jgi:nitrate reductase gamma subunit